MPDPTRYPMGLPPAVDPVYDKYLQDYTHAIAQPIGGSYVNQQPGGEAYKPFGSYDEYLRADQIQKYVRSTNQNFLEQAANGVMGFAGAATAYALETPFALAGAVGGLLNSREGHRFADMARGAGENEPIKAIQEKLDQFKDMFPVHESRAYDEGNIISKMGTSSWLFKDFADGAAFLASAYLTGFGLNGIAKGLPRISELAEQLAKGAVKGSTSEIIAGAATKTFKTLDELGINTKNLSLGAINTTFESGAESGEAGKKVDTYYDSLIEKANAAGELGMAKQLQHEKEINGDKVRASVFATNLALLSISNIWESKWINGTFEDSSKLMTDAIKKKVYTAKMEGLSALEEARAAGASAETLDGISKAMEETVSKIYDATIHKPSKTKAFINGVKVESLYEENTQSATQDHFYNKYVLKKNQGDDVFDLSDFVDIVNTSAKNIAAFGLDLLAIPPALLSAITGANLRAPFETKAGTPEDEAASAMMVAMPMGGFMSMYHAHKEGKAYQAAAEDTKKFIDSLIDLNNLSNVRLLDNIKDPLKVFNRVSSDDNGMPIEGESLINPETGRPSSDLDKIVNRAQRQNLTIEKDDISNQTVLNNDELNWHRNVQEGLAADVWTKAAFQNMEVDEETLKMMYDLNPSLTGAVAKELGLTDVHSKNRADIDEYSKMFFALQKKFYTPQNLVDTSLANVLATKQLFKAAYFAEAKKYAILKSAENVGKKIALPEMDKYEKDIHGTDDPLFNATLEELALTNQQIKDIHSKDSKLKQIIHDEIYKITDMEQEFQKLIAMSSRTPDEEKRYEELKYRLEEEHLKNSDAPVKLDNHELYTETFRQISNERLQDIKYKWKTKLRGKAKLRMGFGIKLDHLIDKISSDDSLSNDEKLDAILKYSDTVKIPEYEASTSKFIQAIKEYSKGYTEAKFNKTAVARILMDIIDDLNTISADNPSGSARVIQDLLEGLTSHEFLLTPDGHDFVANVLGLDNEIDSNGKIILRPGEFNEDGPTREIVNKAYGNAIKNNIAEKLAEYKHNINEQYHLTQEDDNHRTQQVYRNNIDLLEEQVADTEKLRGNEHEYLIKAAFNDIFATVINALRTYGVDLTKELGDLQTLKNASGFRALETKLKRAKTAFEVRKDISEEFRAESIKRIDDLLDFVSRLITQMIANQGAQADTNSFYKDTYQKNMARAIGMDIKGDTHTLLDNNVTKAIAEVSTDLADDYDFLRKMSYDSFAVHGFLAHIKAKATTEQLNKIIKALEESYASAGVELISKLHESRKNSKAYLNHPNRHIKDLILSGVITKDSEISYQKLSQYEGNPFFLLNQHSDIFEFMLELEKTKDLIPEKEKQQILDFLNNDHLPYVGILDAKNSLLSKLSYVKTVEAIIETAAAKNINLSDQQVTSLYQVLEFLGTPGLDTDLYGFATFLNGSLGSGKSTVGAFALEVFKKISPKEPTIYAIGHSSSSTKAINNKLFGDMQDGNPDYNVILNAKFLSEHDVIVIDEAIAFPNEFHYTLDRIISKELKPNQVPKILYIGDVSQIKYDTVDSSILTNTVATAGVRHTTPLSVIYRTAIPSIASAILSFRDKLQPILEIISQSTVNSNTYSPDAMGVVNMDRAKMLETVSKPSARSRVVITNTLKEAENFISDVLNTSGKSLKDLNLQVLDYHTAAGITVDEAYILMSSNGLSRDGRTISTKEFNNAMYTSTGRGSKFLAIAPEAVRVSSTKVDGLDDKFDISEQELNNLKTTFNDTMDSAKATLNRFFGKEFKLESKKKPEAPKGNEDDAPGTPPGQKEPKGVEVEDGTHRIAYPTNSSIAKLSSSAKVHIVPVKSTSSRGDFATSYYLIADSEETSDDGTPIYMTVGVLSGKDIMSDSFSEYFSRVIEPSDKPVVTSSAIINSPTFQLTEDIKKSIIDSLSIAKLQKLEVQYSPLKVRESLDDLITRWEEGFYSNTDEAPPYRKPDGSIDYSSKYFEVRIITNKFKKQLRAEGNIGFIPFAGFPALIIRNYTPNSDTPSVPQVIELSAPPLNSSEEQYHSVIKPISDFSEALDVIEDILKDHSVGNSKLKLGTEAFNEFVRTYAKDVLLTSGNKLGDDKNLIFADPQLQYNTVKYFFSQLNIDLSEDDLNSLVTHLATILKGVYAMRNRQLVISKEQIKDYDPKHFEFDQVNKKNEDYFRVFEKDLKGERTPYVIPQPTINFGPVSIALNNIASYSGVKQMEDSKNTAFNGLMVGGNNIAVLKRDKLGKPLGVYAKTIFAEDNSFGEYYAQLRNALADRLEYLGAEDKLKKMSTEALRKEFEDKFGYAELKEILDDLEHIKGIRLNSNAFKPFRVAPNTPIKDDNGFTLGYSLSKVTVDMKGAKSPHIENPLLNEANRQYFADNTTNGFVQAVPTILDLHIPGTKTKEKPKSSDVASTIVNNEHKYPKIDLNAILDNVKPQWKPLADMLRGTAANTYAFTIPHKFGFAYDIRHEESNANPDLPHTRIAIGEAILGDETILHELLHAATNEAINSVYMGGGTAREKQFVERLRALQSIYNKSLFSESIGTPIEVSIMDSKTPYEHVVKTLTPERVTDKTVYFTDGTQSKLHLTSPLFGYEKTESSRDIREFVANLSSSQFYHVANNILIEKKSMFRVILDAILKLLGVSPTVYNTTLATVSDFLSPTIAEEVTPTNSDMPEDIMTNLETYLANKVNVDPIDYADIEELYNYLKTSDPSTHKDAIKLNEDILKRHNLYRSFVTSSSSTYSPKEVLKMILPDVSIKAKSWSKILVNVFVKDIINSKERIMRKISHNAFSKSYGDTAILLWDKVFSDKYKRTIVSAFKLETGHELESLDQLSDIVNKLSKKDSNGTALEKLTQDIVKLSKFVLSNEDTIRKSERFIRQDQIGEMLVNMNSKKALELIGIFGTARAYNYAKSIVQKKMFEELSISGWSRRLGEHLETNLGATEKIQKYISEQSKSDLFDEINKQLQARKITDIVSSINELSELYHAAVENQSKAATMDDRFKYSRQVNALSAILEEAEHRFRALQVLTNPKAFKAVVKSIFEYWNDEDLKALDPEDTTTSGDSKIDQVYKELGLKNEIADNEKTNPLSSNIAKIRQFLSTIPITTSESSLDIVRFVNPRFATKRLLELIPNYIDFNSLHTFGDFETKNTQMHKIASRELVDFSTRAILTELTKLIQMATKEIHNKHIEVFVDSSQSVAAPTIHLMYSPNKIDISHMSPEEARLADPEIIIYSSNGINLYNLKFKLNNLDKVDLTTKEFNEYYVRANAMELVRNFQTTMGSLANIEYMSGLVEFKYPNQASFRYFEAKGLGSKQRVNANIDQAMDSLYRGQTSIDGKKIDLRSDWLTTEVLDKVKSHDSLEIRNGIINFLTLLGYGHVVKNMPPSALLGSKASLDLKDDIETFFSYIINPYKAAKKANLDTLLSNWEDQRSFKRNIVKFLSSADEVANIDVIRDSKGDMVYTKIPTTSYRIAMKMLDDYHNSSRAKELDNFNNGDIALSPYNTRFYQKNIFVAKLNTIHNYNTRHDGYRHQLFSRNLVTTDASNMSYKQDLLSQFGLQFLATVNQYAGVTYFQGIWQQGEATKRELSRINVLSENKLKEGLSLMIDQLKSPDSNLTKNASYSSMPLNFDFYVKARLELPNGTREEIIDKILDYIAENAVKLANDWNNQDLPLPDNISDIYSKLFGETAPFNANEVAARLTRVTGEEHEARAPQLTPVNKEIKTYVSKVKNPESGHYNTVEHERNMLRALMFAWAANRYVNSYGLSQFALGDFNMYKNNYDLAKRSQASGSPGTIPLVHARAGLPSHSRLFILNDQKISKTTSTDENISTSEFLAKFDLTKDELENILSAYPEDYELTDGSSVVTERYFNQLRKAFGSNYDLRRIMKDQYFGNAVKLQIDTSVEYPTARAVQEKFLGLQSDGKLRNIASRNDKSFVKAVEITKPDGTTVFYPQMMHLEAAYLKNSIFVITPDIAAKNPKLKALANFMDSPGSSDVTGEARQPIDILTFRSGNKVALPKEGLDNVASDLTDLQMDNNTRLIDNRFFKMQYNPYSESQSTAAPRQLQYFLAALGTNQEASSMVNKAILGIQEMGISHAQAKLATRGSVSDFVRTSISKQSDSYVVAKLLEAGLTIDHPSVEKKGLIALGSAIEKATVRIRIPGLKLTLSSPYGFTNPRTGKPLQVKPFNSQGPIAEALIHADLLDDNMKAALKSGHRLFVSPDFLGFRIPTSEMHSATAVEIVGTHYEDNITSTIIMPHELIPIQGWDFDIDSLFILRRSSFANPISINGKDYLPSDYVGYEADDNNVHQKNFDEFETNLINEIKLTENEIARSKDLIQAEKDNDINQLFKDNIAANKVKLKDLRAIRIALYNNMMVEAYLQAVTAPQNMSRMLTPISTNIFTGETNSVQAFLKSHKIFSSNSRADMGLFENDHNAYSSLTNAARGIGVIANGMKIDAYTRTSSSTKGYPTIKESKNTFSINGNLVDRFSEHIDVFGKTKTVYEVKDTILNLYLDAIKNPLLYPLGFLGSNAAVIDTAISLDGIPFSTIALLFNLPFVKQMYLNKEENQMMREMKKEDRVEHINITDEELISLYTTPNEGVKSKVKALLYKLTNISRDRSKIRSTISLTQSLPVTREQLYQVQNDVENIVNSLDAFNSTSWSDYKTLDQNNTDMLEKQKIDYNSSFGLDITNFFKDNPQIYSAVKMAAVYKNIVDKNFRIYSPAASKLASQGLVEAYDPDYTSEDTWRRKVEAHRAVSDFLLRSIVSDYVRNTTPIVFGEYVINKDKAFIYSLIQKINLIKAAESSLLRDNPSYPINKFISQLIVTPFKGDKLTKIRVGDGGTVTANDYDTYYDAFEKLSAYSFTPVIENGVVTKFELSTLNKDVDASGYSTFQKDLLRYSLLTNGLRLDNDNYNQLITPALLFSETGDINKIYQKYLGDPFRYGVGKIDNITVLRPGNNITYPFIISQSLRNIDALPYITNAQKPTKEQQEEIDKTGIVHKAALVMKNNGIPPISVQEKSYDKATKKEKVQALIRVKILEADNGINIGLYQSIGDNTTYVLFPEDKYYTYYIKDHFKTDLPTAKVLSDIDIATVGSTFTRDNKYMPKGDYKNLYVVHTNDPARYFLSKAEVVSRDENQTTLKIIATDLAVHTNEPVISESKSTRKYTSENITHLEPNQVFVFGSNAEGIHGKGAALTAKQHFGAKQGQAEGIQGQSYAVITKANWRVEKSSSLEQIQEGLTKMLDYAKQHPEKEFLVTKLGSSLAGYTIAEIKSLFENLKSSIPDNVILPEEYEVRSSNSNLNRSFILFNSELTEKAKEKEDECFGKSGYKWTIN